jgi:hypothetical protein
MSAVCGLLSLPTEILLKIFRYLNDPRWILRLGTTCKRLAAFSHEEMIWRPLVHRYFPPAVKYYTSLSRKIREGWEDLVQLFSHLSIEGLFAMLWIRFPPLKGNNTIPNLLPLQYYLVPYGTTKSEILSKVPYVP